MGLQHDYPWVKAPIIIGAPMRLISLAPLAVAVSRAGGLGFIGAGTEVQDLQAHLQEASRLTRETPIVASAANILPIGVGFINWGADLDTAVRTIGKYRPAAVWFFAPYNNADLVQWTRKIRNATQGDTKIWLQVGSVRDAVEVAALCRPDVIVAQGSDAGGHGLERGAGIISLLPEIADALKHEGFEDISIVAAGGIVEGRGVAACLALGSEGVVMGTRFLASTEATIATGYQRAVVRANDGGISTVRSKVYDTLRGTTGWPERIGGRGIINQSFLDAKDGKVTKENMEAHVEALKKGDAGWGENGRLTTYAGTGVGLVDRIQPAAAIIEEIRRQVIDIELRTSNRQSKI
ncbi:MAG: hypothetical protein L6R38_002267 [Xanthoria sp. 2 TBL-2021]|nr:MAG: hypothetical protein L6R38_002267 [Xanthoria sp. 2 TBL-2021]